VNDDERARCGTHSEQKEPLLFLGMFWIMEYARMRIAKNALGLFKPNSMLATIALVLPLAPIEPQHV
jgi:hypothetical protein